MNPKLRKLLDGARDTLRLKQYANKTEQAFLNWIKQYILFHGKKKHPQGMGACEVESFLTGKLQHLPKIRRSVPFCSFTVKYYK